MESARRSLRALLLFPTPRSETAADRRRPETTVRCCLSPALFVLAICTLAPSIFAEEPAALAADVQQLKTELEALRAEYAKRLTELDARLAALGQPMPEVAAPSSTTPTPAVAEASFVPTPAPAGASKVFNPDIAAIGDFIGVAGKTPGSGERSLDMHESELSFQAVVDPYARADFFLTFGPDEVGVEEGFITFPTLPGGLLLKVGKMRDAFGKVDGQHNHVLPFIDRPLVNRNLIGGEDALADAGISVARLIPNPWVFLEATAQVYRGDSAIFKAPTRGDLAYVGHLRAYQDLTESTNIDLGGSVAYGHNGVTADSATRLLGFDATFRYRPLRRSIYTHLLGRTELTWSRRQNLTQTANAFGGYGYLEYQFGRRWFAGARYDFSDRAENSSLTDKGGSLILTYWPSEFSQIRTQYRHTRFGEGRTANELLFQFLFAIGAHGAHAF
jgi:hypothetical protein